MGYANRRYRGPTIRANSDMEPRHIELLRALSRPQLRACHGCGEEQADNAFAWFDGAGWCFDDVCADCRREGRRNQGQRVKRRVLDEKRATVYGRDGFACVTCGTTGNLTIDHIVPLSRGGTNHIDNLQTMCARCNNAKGNAMPPNADALRRRARQRPALAA